MPTIDALTDAVDVLRRNPVLFAAGAVQALVLLPQTVLRLLGFPILAFLIGMVTFFIMPFVLAGTIGMAYEGLSGGTALGTFTDVGKSQYGSMLGGALIRWVINIAFLIVALVVGGTTAVVIGAGFDALTGGDAPSQALAGVGAASLLILVGVVGLILLAYLAIAFLIQFFPPAIVVEDRGAIGSLKRSYAVVRANLVSALGYSAISFVIGVVVAIMGGLAGLGGQGGLSPLAEGANGTLALAGGAATTVGLMSTLAVGIILYPFQQAFATAFYVRHADVDASAGDDSGLNTAAN